METLTSYHTWRLPNVNHEDNVTKLTHYINEFIPKEWADFEVSYTIEIPIPIDLYPSSGELTRLNQLARHHGWDGGAALIALEDGKLYLLLMAARVMIPTEKGCELVEEEWPSFRPKHILGD
jgi:hypothetical protein